MTALSFDQGIGWRSLLSGSAGNADTWTYDQLDRYFTGRQPLSYLHPEVAKAAGNRLRTLILNWPRLVVETLEGRLDVEGFRMGDASSDELWRIWQANDLDEWSQELHIETLVHGRGYAIVWADDEDKKTPRISVESSQQVSVHYQPGTRVVASAVKKWVEDDLAYATLYLPDTVARYVGPPELLSSSRDVQLTEDSWVLRETPVSHDLGQVPVVPFVNRPRLSRPYGETELSDVIPLADAVCKLATDMMVTSEYHSMPRRWATGVDLGGPAANERVREEIKQYWTEAAAGRFALSSNPNATFGEFSEASLAGFVEAIGVLTHQAAAMAGLPVEYLGGMGPKQPASADAIRSAEATLVKRALRKQRVLGGSWERVMRLALRVQGGPLPEGVESLETQWRDPQTPTVAEKADAALKLVMGGIISKEQAREDLGYSPVQLQRMATSDAQAALGPVPAQLAAAKHLQATEGLSQPASLAAVGLLQAAGLQHEANTTAPAAQ